MSFLRKKYQLPQHFLQLFGSLNNCSTSSKLFPFVSGNIHKNMKNPTIAIPVYR